MIPAWESCLRECGCHCVLCCGCPWSASRHEDYVSQRILVDAAFAAAVEEDGFVTAYPPVERG